MFRIVNLAKKLHAADKSSAGTDFDFCRFYKRGATALIPISEEARQMYINRARAILGQ